MSWRQSRAIMSHDFKSNFSPYTKKDHIIIGSLRTFYYENLLKILVLAGASTKNSVQFLVDSEQTSLFLRVHKLNLIF